MHPFEKFLEFGLGLTYFNQYDEVEIAISSCAQALIRSGRGYILGIPEYLSEQSGYLAAENTDRNHR